MFQCFQIGITEFNVFLLGVIPKLLYELTSPILGAGSRTLFCESKINAAKSVIFYFPIPEGLNLCNPG